MGCSEGAQHGGDPALKKAILVGGEETRTQHRTQRAAAKKQPSTRKLIVEVALRFARYVGRQQLMVARDRVCHATHVANPG